ncbi:hypothetical protein VKT23_002846 [Stygiomarasmius scandens]|uniref:Peroxin/Ferlin domain-containing protein n=1 Tax=Marasmiellus scandens TaxID=2682957 RepID=A0ABR1JVF1_9AGAR
MTSTTTNPSTATTSMHEFVNAVPFQLTAVLVRLGPFFALVRYTLETITWTRSSLDSWLTLAAWWTLCIAGSLALKYFLPLAIFIPLVFASFFSSSNSRSTPPTISESSLQAAISDLTVIQSLLPPIPSFSTYISPNVSAAKLSTVLRATAIIYVPYLLLTHLIPLRIIVALVGTFVLSYRSPHFKFIRTTLTRSAFIRWTYYQLWSFITGTPLPPKSMSFQPTSTSAEPQNSLRFLFTIYENQRWWMGLDWTGALLPGERPSWCTASQQPVSPPNAFFLPEPTTVFVRDGNGRRIKRTATWRWEESEWRVLVRKEGGAMSRVEKPLPAMNPSEKDQGILMKAAGKMKEANAAHAAAAASSKEGGSEDREHGGEDDDDETQEEEVITDPDGWVYGDNKWEAKSAKGGMGKYTRYRRWTRVAVVSETVEVVEDGELGIEHSDSNYSPYSTNMHSPVSTTNPSLPSSASNSVISNPSTSPKIIPKVLPGSVSDPTVSTSSTGEFSINEGGGKDGPGTSDSKLRQRLKSALAKQAIH